MSSFNDASFRSQQMVAPYQMQGAMNKTAGIQSIGQGLASAAGQWNQAQNQAAELALRTAEADTRIQAFQQEQELNAYKLQQAMALDQAGLSRLQVEGAKQQVEMGKLQLKEAQFKTEHMTEGMEQKGAEHSAKMQEYRMNAAGGMSGIRARGKVLGDDGKPRDPTDEGEFDTFWQRFDEGEKAGRGYQADPSQTRISFLSREIDRQRRIVNDDWASDEDRADARRRMEAASKELDSAYQQAGMGQSGGSAAPPPPPAPAPGQQTPPTGSAGSYQGDLDAGRIAQPVQRRGFAAGGWDEATINHVQQAAFDSEQWQQSPFWSRLNVDEGSRAAIAQGIGHFANSFVKFQKAQNGLNIDPRMAHEYVFDMAQKRPESMAYLLMLTGSSDEEVGMQLQVLFPNLKKPAIDRAMSVALQTAEQATK